MFAMKFEILTNHLYLLVQWNLSNPTHQGTREMCRIVQDVVKLRFSFLVNRNLHKFNKRRNYVCLIM
jgi:hypothetical protein